MFARVYQKSRRTTNPNEAVEQTKHRWATKTLPADITFVSFFTTIFAVAVTATMFFVFNFKRFFEDEVYAE